MSSLGSTVTAPNFSASARRFGCGSLTTMSVTPRARAAAIDNVPIGPAPVISNRWPARTPPCVRPCKRDRERLGERGGSE